MAPASPVRAAACSGVVAPRSKESVAAGRRLWAVFFLNERFFGAIDAIAGAAIARASLLRSRCQGAKVPLWGFARCTAGP